MQIFILLTKCLNYEECYKVKYVTHSTKTHQAQCSLEQNNIYLKNQE